MVTRHALLVAGLCLAQASTAQAQPALLKSNVVIVKPQYHQKTRETFGTWSKVFDKLADEVQRGDPRKAALAGQLRVISRYYEAQATSPGHGSGWLFMPSRDRAYVVTNRHVAGQAASVVVEFDHNRYPRVANCPVVYVDPLHDIAILEVPRANLPRDATGFEIARTSLTEGNPVWASGFPGTQTESGQVPIYSLTNGIVNNADYPGPEGSAIAHSATIDPGNSGGPLLTEDPTARLGFKVSGMNTWKANSRSNVNIAVPIGTIEEALRAAQEAQHIERTPAQLAQALRTSARRLADELGSTRPNNRYIGGLIAYSFVAQRTGIFDFLISSWASGKMNQEEESEFLSEPVEFARAVLGDLFISTFSTGQSNVGAVRLESITDEDRLSTQTTVRTIYAVAGKKQEIMWTWEHGAWRISDASFEQALVGPGGLGTTKSGDTAGQTKTTGPDVHATEVRLDRDPGVSLAARVGFGSSGANGQDFKSELSSNSMTSFGLELAIPFSRYVGMATGVAYEPRGASYPILWSSAQYNISENVAFLELPLLLRFEIPIVTSSFTVRLFGKAGAALDYAVSKGGTYAGSGGSGALDNPSVDWYQKFKALNVAAVYGGGVEVGVGPSPEFYVGIDVTGQQHLLSEWESNAFTSGENYRYQSTQLGLFFKYQALR